MTTIPRPFTPDEDGLIRAHWDTKSSNAIGAMMVPPRDGSAIRIRARRLKLAPKQSGCRNLGEANGMSKAANRERQPRAAAPREPKPPRKAVFRPFDTGRRQRVFGRIAPPPVSETEAQRFARVKAYASAMLGRPV